MSGALPLQPIYAFMAWTRTTLHFTFIRLSVNPNYDLCCREYKLVMILLCVLFVCLFVMWNCLSRLRCLMLTEEDSLS